MRSQKTECKRLFSSRLMHAAYLFFCLFVAFFGILSAEENSSIDQELAGMKKNIEDLRLKIMHAEMQSQPYLRYEWGGYVEEIEKAEGYEKALKELEAKYNKLLLEKEMMEKGQ